jgi:ATP-dependent exoDNAse (exonuclease V) alpha subunit
LTKWRKENRWKKIVTVAPTWIAAINVWWSTIHSAFKLHFGTKFFMVSKQKIKWKKIKTLIIDEWSMVWVWILEQINKTLQKECWNKKPFWWIQVIIVWDLAQLQPIISDWKERLDIEDRFWWIEFYHSDAYKDWDFVEINLKENKRTNDDKLIEWLNKIRNNKFDINDFQLTKFTEAFSNEATHIMPYNYQVDSFNTEKLHKLKRNLHTFKARTTWNFNVKNVLSPETLNVKVWAKIMITKNLEIWLVNWDMWTIKSINEDSFVIYSFRTEIEYYVPREKWEDKRYDEEWNEEIVWTFVQFPVKLWRASTIHKAQWLTFKKVVFYYNKRLDMKSVYTWLSRSVTWKNLYIKK